MKKILLSLGMIAVVGALVAGATGAFFSDTETSKGNTFTTGAIHLKVGSEAYYNNVLVPAAYWLEKNLVPTADKFFNFADIKPGDSGENTITLDVLNNDAWVCVAVSNLKDFENGCNDPETKAGDTTCGNPGEGQGELSKNMNWTVWRDTNGDNVLNEAVPAQCANHIDTHDLIGCSAINNQANCESISECTWNPGHPGEIVLATGHPTNGVLPVYDSTTATGPLPTTHRGYIGVEWGLPSATGNEAQTDSLIGDVSLYAVQSRNNLNFKCSDWTPTPPAP